MEEVETCEAKSKLLTDPITTGADIIMPVKRIKVHVNDPPWVTSYFKKIIKAHKQAYSNGEKETYRHYCNLVNHERKILRNRFFASTVRHLKDTKPNQWWNAVRRIAAMATPCTSEALRAQLQMPGTDSLSPHEIANMINMAFLEPMQTYQIIEPPSPSELILNLYQISFETYLLLTPSISKVAKEFVVKLYMAPAILQIIDPCQFGAIPKSSTAPALISMIHNWAQATDATGAAVRFVLLDYKKAFDLIDQQVLLQKIFSYCALGG